MVDFFALGGLLSLVSRAHQQTAGTRDIRALRYAAVNDREAGYGPVLARQDATYRVAFSLDRRNPAYSIAFSAN